jgi:hypothetical protein
MRFDLVPGGGIFDEITQSEKGMGRERKEVHHKEIRFQKHSRGFLLPYYNPLVWAVKRFWVWSNDKNRFKTIS